MAYLNRGVIYADCIQAGRCAPSDDNVFICFRVYLLDSCSVSCGVCVFVPVSLLGFMLLIYLRRHCFFPSILPVTTNVLNTLSHEPAWYLLQLQKKAFVLATVKYENFGSCYGNSDIQSA
jgi:hypothetical protein